MGKPLVFRVLFCFSSFAIVMLNIGCSTGRSRYYDWVEVSPKSYHIDVEARRTQGRLTASALDTVVAADGSVTIALTNRGLDIVSIVKSSIQLYINDTLFTNSPLSSGAYEDAFYGSSNSSGISLSSSGSYVPNNPYTAMFSGGHYGERAAGRTMSDALSSSSSQMVGRLVRGSEMITLHPNTTAMITLYDPNAMLMQLISSNVVSDDDEDDTIRIASGKRYDHDAISKNMLVRHSENVARVLDNKRIRLIIGYSIVNQDPKLTFEDFVIKARNPVFRTGW